MSATQAIGVYFRLHTKRLGRGRLRIVTLLLLALPIIGTGIAVPFARDVFDEIAEVYMRLIVPFLPALLASPIVAEEIENKTFTFLFARPAPRWTMVIGKYFATMLPLIVGVAISV